MKDFDHVVNHVRRQARKDANPENIIHDEICILKRTDHSMLYVLVCRLAQQVAGKEKARGDFSALKMSNGLVASKGRTWTDTDRKSEPARLPNLSGLHTGL